VTNKFGKANRLMVVGVSFLALANVWNWVLLRHTQIGESFRDFSFGLFMGIAIGTLLLSIFFQVRARRCRGNDDSPLS
jgi:hypothetical protein